MYQPWVGRKISLLNPPEAKWRQSFNGIQNVSARKKERVTAHYVAVYLQSQERRDQPEDCLQSSVNPVRESGEEPTCIFWNLRAYLNTKNCACFFPRDSEGEALISQAQKCGTKRDHVIGNLRRKWRQPPTHSRLSNLSEGAEEDSYAWVDMKEYPGEEKAQTLGISNSCFLKWLGCRPKAGLKEDMGALTVM